MFVMNCHVDTASALKFPLSKREQKKQAHLKKKQQQHQAKKQEPQSPVNPVVEDDDEVFNAVKCVQCSTQVAVYDSDEIYHFYNVLASQS